MNIQLRAILCNGLILAVASLAPAAEVSQAQLENQRCFNCHSQSHIAQLPPDQRHTMVAPSVNASKEPVRPQLLVTPEHLAGSMHENVACISCHPAAAELPHVSPLPAPTCDTAGCHNAEAVAFRRGVHAEALAKQDPQAPTCVTCHGGHDIKSRTQRDSSVYPLNVVKLCADCHAQHKDPTGNGHDGRNYMQSYLESVHGKAVVEGGLVVAATCADCHGSHEVLPAANPDSPINREHVADTCGRCHMGVNETFAKSIHGQLATQGNPEAPVCTDCHTAHSISQAGTPDFMRDILNECGTCHNKPNRNGTLPYETYRRSYHGQVTALGSGRAAGCADCHGAHDILPQDDPASRINDDNRVRTCAACHPKANANFARFQPHADFYDGKNYPLLHGVWLYFIIIMSGTFGFFGIHSLLWFVRSSIHRRRHGKPNHHGSARSVRRFNTVDRINHAFVIITFFGLTLTGMPLLLSDQPWAKTMITMFGGVHGAGLLHRIFAVMLIGNFLVHGYEVLCRAREHGVRSLIFGPNTMIPRWKDVTDCLGMFRWFFGAKRKPRFDHFTYWEKFDYWAEIFGTFVIGGTGLMLWFPVLFSKFMPGWMFNVATIVHGYEALLAVGFIFTIHFFNAHLRWEKFPVDDVMFTGSLPESEFIEEREVEYEHLKQTGELEKLIVPPPPRWQRKVAVAAGIVAMLIGTLIVVLIIAAGLSAL
ncbi:MAG: hypothetical protein IT445_05355 [Phycisphaeraceae bacterium]|nr:hypothetical protein [Phycisphaeraceae bacterium]